jgi:type III secretory pathway component EscU
MKKFFTVILYIAGIIFSMLYLTMFGSAFILLIASDIKLVVGIVITGWLSYSLMDMLISIVNDIIEKFNGEV